jgi:inosine/xanthosine triphosphate pyrophosphatase family protein
VADFTFVTSNSHKVTTARAVCQKYGLTFIHKTMDLVEIQAETGEPIALNKVKQAYMAVKAPVVVTDDSWFIPGLMGFPGPYMKYINGWFEPEDFLRLTQALISKVK